MQKDVGGVGVLAEQCTQRLPRQTAKVHPQDDTKQCTHINTNPFQTHASYSYNVTISEH